MSLIDRLTDDDVERAVWTLGECHADYMAMAARVRRSICDDGRGTSASDARNLEYLDRMARECRAAIEGLNKKELSYYDPEGT
jgi:hypothetical protein